MVERGSFYFTGDSYHSVGMQVWTAQLFRLFGERLVVVKIVNWVFWLALLALASWFWMSWNFEAWIVGIRGYEFDEFGERLSERARENLEAAATWVRRALQSDEFREVR